MSNEMTTLGAGAMAYLSTHGAGAGVAGINIKFDGKQGRYLKTLNGEEIPEGTECICPYDQIIVGWIKFQGPGVPPVRENGRPFSGYNPPKRDEMGDDDKTLWKEGLNGRPEDPWQLEVVLPLQNKDTGEMYAFQTTSISGRRAADALIWHCQRMASSDPDNYPVVKLTKNSFKKPKVGTIPCPQFVVIGKAPKDNAAAVDTTIAGDMDDDIPF